MKAVQFMVMIAIAATLSACAGGGGSGSNKPETVGVDSNGGCSEDLRTIINNMAFEAIQMKSAAQTQNNEMSKASLERFDKLCDQLYPKYENVSCVAFVNYENKTIEVNQNKEACTKTKQFLAQIADTQKAKIEPQPSQENQEPSNKQPENEPPQI